MRLIYIIIVLLSSIPLSVSGQGYALDAPDGITALSYILVDMDSFEIIAGRDFHRPMPPASTTKVLTTIVALESLTGNETIVPDRGVLKLPRSKLNLLPGKKYRADDLIKGAMIESANDAAYALAAYIGGSEADFARIMNKKAVEIGAINSIFKNASGLYVPGQQTTCYDLALIFRYALSNKRFKEIISMRYFLFNEGKKSVRYQNHNRFLFCFEPAIGGKTGYTRVSRHSYVGAFEKNNKTYILAILGSEDKWGDAVEILKILYDRVPSDRELVLAKASPIVLSSYNDKKNTKKIAKTPKKQRLKPKKNSNKPSRRR
ncbi:MAG: D-alanyl-D-alanine carboxypeptidase [Syntrophorhabdaceae bacterium]|nr:D-alanyl-D-alanine carboxypeptidase [Syntrophorhabdaceae bacterium]